jgi:hypothetical protein
MITAFTFLIIGMLLTPPATAVLMLLKGNSR